MNYKTLSEHITGGNLTPENWEIAHCAGPRGGLYLIPKSWDIQSNRIGSTNPQLEPDGRLKRYRILFEFFQLPQSGKFKISVRIRTNDPIQGEAYELAIKLEAPQPRKVDGETFSLIATRTEAGFKGDDYPGACGFIQETLSTNSPNWLSEFILETKKLLEASTPTNG